MTADMRCCDGGGEDGYHRWNCQATPIWAQTIRALDTNPWTVLDREQHRATLEYLLDWPAP